MRPRDSVRITSSARTAATATKIIPLYSCDVCQNFDTGPRFRETCGCCVLDWRKSGVRVSVVTDHDGVLDDTAEERAFETSSAGEGTAGLAGCAWAGPMLSDLSCCSATRVGGDGAIFPGNAAFDTRPSCAHADGSR